MAEVLKHETLFHNHQVLCTKIPFLLNRLKKEEILTRAFKKEYMDTISTHFKESTQSNNYD